jgi:DNA-directed RNA polymerase subunit RPC12/RpoP
MEKTTQPKQKTIDQIYCPYCTNLFIKITTADTFVYKCVQCQQTFVPSDNNTLQYEDVKGANLAIFGTLLHTAKKDPCNPKVYKDCKDCKNDIVTQIRIGQDMKLINTCTNCGKQWFDIVNE